MKMNDDEEEETEAEAWDWGGSEAERQLAEEAVALFDDTRHPTVADMLNYVCVKYAFDFKGYCTLDLMSMGVYVSSITLGRSQRRRASRLMR